MISLKPMFSSNINQPMTGLYKIGTLVLKGLSKTNKWVKWVKNKLFC